MILPQFRHLETNFRILPVIATGAHLQTPRLPLLIPAQAQTVEMNPEPRLHAADTAVATIAMQSSSFQQRIFPLSLPSASGHHTVGPATRQFVFRLSGYIMPLPVGRHFPAIITANESGCFHPSVQLHIPL